MCRSLAAVLAVLSLIATGCEGRSTATPEQVVVGERLDRAEARSDVAATQPQAPAEPAGSPSTYYQWVDERGSVHFEESLEAVPAEWRGRAGRIEIDPSAVKKAAAPRARPALRMASAEVEPAVRRAHDVTIYTAPWCGWCQKTIAFLDQKGVDYVNKDIEADPSYEDELREKTGRTSIPLVEIDGEQIRGYSPGRMTELLAN